MWIVYAYKNGEWLAREATGNLERTHKAARMLKAKLKIKFPKDRIAVCYTYELNDTKFGTTYV